MNEILSIFIIFSGINSLLNQHILTGHHHINDFTFTLCRITRFIYDHFIELLVLSPCDQSDSRVQ